MPYTMSDTVSLVNESPVLKRLDLSGKLAITILLTLTSTTITLLQLLIFSNTIQAGSKKQVHIRSRQNFCSNLLFRRTR